MTMFRLALLLPAALTLAACEDMAPKAAGRPAATPVVATAPAGTPVVVAPEGETGPAARPGADGKPVVVAPEGEAAPPAAAAGGRLGTTVASLGAATEGGLWLKTPLVKAKTTGRVVNPETGKSAEVTLLPLAGPASAGSQASIATMQALGAGLTDLPEIEVFAA